MQLLFLLCLEAFMVTEFNKVFSSRELCQGVIHTLKGVIHTLTQLPAKDSIGFLFLACSTNPLHSLSPSIYMTNAVQSEETVTVPCNF